MRRIAFTRSVGMRLRATRARRASSLSCRANFSDSFIRERSIEGTTSVDGPRFQPSPQHRIGRASGTEVGGRARAQVTNRTPVRRHRHRRRRQGRVGACLQVHAPDLTSAVACVAHLSRHSRSGPRCYRLLPRAHPHRPSALRVRLPAPSPPCTHPYQRHGPSNGLLDCAADRRGIRRRGGSWSRWWPSPRPRRACSVNLRPPGHRGLSVNGLFVALAHFAVYASRRSAGWQSMWCLTRVPGSRDVMWVMGAAVGLAFAVISKGARSRRRRVTRSELQGRRRGSHRHSDPRHPRPETRVTCSTWGRGQTGRTVVEARRPDATRALAHGTA
jgi:hypothetical protein